MSYDKIVVLVWTQKCCNCKGVGFNSWGVGYWGLGDLIRGTIKLYQLSKIMGFKLIVNIDLHPISLFLKKRYSEYDKMVLENKNKINFILPGQVENYINNTKDEIIFLLTNDFCNINNIDLDCKNFIKDILTPNNELNYLLSEQKISEYDIIHLRLGDDNIIDDKIDQNKNIKLKNILINNIDNKNSILMCDSKYFKKKLKEDVVFNDIIKIFDLDICHVGYETDSEKLKNTMFEFFIISKSNLIKTYSVYSWTSGFVQWISIIYDIPLIKIN